MDKLAELLENHRLEIAELEAELKETHVGTLTFTPQEYRKVRADAIREMLNNAKQFTHNPSSIKVSTIIEYADYLEQSE